MPGTVRLASRIIALTPLQNWTSMTNHNHFLGGNLKTLQILRFIAASSVVYHHIEASPNFGSFGVDIFFVLSGFVIALVLENRQSAKHFAIGRMTRIIPLYWILTTAILFLIYVATDYVNPSTARSANLANYFKSIFFHSVCF
jgi:exopolysaccharide production protein ExoZ